MNICCILHEKHARSYRKMVDLKSWYLRINLNLFCSFTKTRNLMERLEKYVVEFSKKIISRHFQMQLMNNKNVNYDKIENSYCIMPNVFKRDQSCLPFQTNRLCQKMKWAKKKQETCTCKYWHWKWT